MKRERREENLRIIRDSAYQEKSRPQLMSAIESEWSTMQMAELRYLNRRGDLDREISDARARFRIELPRLLGKLRELDALRVASDRRASEMRGFDIEGLNDLGLPA